MGITEKKEQEALWKKGSAYLTTKLLTVIPVFPAVGLLRKASKLPLTSERNSESNLPFAPR
jgi:hypothetical protein